MSATINGITCDPTTAKRVYTAIGGGGNFETSGFNRFDEVLFRNAEGFFFLVRPLDPEEAGEWLHHPSHDHVLARQLFPGDDGDEKKTHDMNETTTTEDPSAALRMQRRLAEMSEAERAGASAIMARDETSARVLTLALGATPAELRELLELLEAEMDRRADVRA